MPDPIMFTEAALLYGPPFATRRERRPGSTSEFEIFAKMRGLPVGQLDPTTLRQAAEGCSQCACRRACRRWLRTGTFNYSGDSRCPNAGLLAN